MTAVPLGRQSHVSSKYSGRRSRRTFLSARIIIEGVSALLSARIAIEGVSLVISTTRRLLVSLRAIAKSLAGLVGNCRLGTLIPLLVAATCGCFLVFCCGCHNRYSSSLSRL